MRSTEPNDPQESDDSRRGRHSRRRGASSQDSSSGKKKGSFWKELPLLIVTALVLTVVIQAFLGRVYLIPSESMEQTLHGCSGCDNDRVLVDKVSYRFSDPQPGDVVVFRGPDAWGKSETASGSGSGLQQFFGAIGSLLGFGAPGEKDFVKRVIATGGQTVQCCDPQNRVLVDGKPLHESYIFWAPGQGNTQQEFKPVRVPAGHLWVMGDNRNESADSRIQGGGGVNGAVPVDNVIGKAQVIVLPVTRWSSIPEDNPQS